jgi:hypothetical protein
MDLTLAGVLLAMMVIVGFSALKEKPVETVFVPIEVAVVEMKWKDGGIGQTFTHKLYSGQSLQLGGSETASIHIQVRPIERDKEE